VEAPRPWLSMAHTASKGGGVDPLHLRTMRLRHSVAKAYDPRRIPDAGGRHASTALQAMHARRGAPSEPGTWARRGRPLARSPSRSLPSRDECVRGSSHGGGGILSRGSMAGPTNNYDKRALSFQHSAPTGHKQRGARAAPRSTTLRIHGEQTPSLVSRDPIVTLPKPPLWDHGHSQTTAWP
jgi:hypothetical protein